MTSTEESKTQEEVLKDFTTKIEEFMSYSVEMNRRLNELEISVAYLLQKDPDWLEHFKQSQEQSGELADEKTEQTTGLVEPE